MKSTVVPATADGIINRVLVKFMTAGRRNVFHSSGRNAVDVGSCKVVDIRSRTGLMFSHKPDHDRTVLVVRQTLGGSGWRGRTGRHRSLSYNRVSKEEEKLCVVSFTRFARSPLNNLAIRKFENDSRETYGGFRNVSLRTSPGTPEENKKEKKTPRSRVKCALETNE